MMETNSCTTQSKTNLSVPSRVDPDTRPEKAVVKVGGAEFGGNEVIIIAGPCAVENSEQLRETALAAKKGGARILRGGAFKPRTSPYKFQGLGVDGLKMLRDISIETGMPVVTEVLDTRQVDLIAGYADMLQVGSRNMHNYALLKEVGLVKKPVLLKRGMMATIEEFLLASEYILNQGNTQVVLCERGIRTFETATRNTIDLSAVPMLKHLSRLPVIVDPSHGTGIRWMVPPMAKAAVAAGADGLIMEIHYKPDEALCDGQQSLYPGDYYCLMKDLKKIASAIGRTLNLPSGR